MIAAREAVLVIHSFLKIPWSPLVSLERKLEKEVEHYQKIRNNKLHIFKLLKNILKCY